MIALGRGLRALHDVLPVDRCPYSWSADVRVEQVHRAGVGAGTGSRRVGTNSTATSAPTTCWRCWTTCHRSTRSSAGDACAPNTLLRSDGTWSGHVDMGSLGIGDRWADLAVATWSTEWNYGPGSERPAGRIRDGAQPSTGPRTTGFFGTSARRASASRGYGPSASPSAGSGGSWRACRGSVRCLFG